MNDVELPFDSAKVVPGLHLILLLFLFPCLIYGQQPDRLSDYRQVDSASRTVRYKKDIYKLTKELTEPYSEQVLKVRAIFIWITDNIRYDYKFVNNGREIKYPKCKPGMDCKRVFYNWENNYLKKVLRRKKAICDGYARLFKKMCEIAEIKNEIIGGYTKSKPYQVGLTGPVNHAWNAIWLDTAYFLFDPTWASGYCSENEETGKLLSFTKSYNNYYWMTSFHDLARNHYPKEGRWVLERNYTKEKFAANPFYASEIIPDLQLISPGSGIINAFKGDTIHFKFKYKGDIRKLQVNSSDFRNPNVYKWEKVSRRKKIATIDTFALKKQRYVSFRQNGDAYEFDFVVPDHSLDYVDILFDYRRVMRFKVKVPSGTL
jgi:hypothetical protein